MKNLVIAGNFLAWVVFSRFESWSIECEYWREREMTEIPGPSIAPCDPPFALCILEKTTHPYIPPPDFE